MEIKVGQRFETLSPITFPQLNADGKYGINVNLGGGKTFEITAIDGNRVEFLFEGLDTHYIDINTLNSMIGDCIKVYVPTPAKKSNSKPVWPWIVGGAVLLAGGIWWMCKK